MIVRTDIVKLAAPIYRQIHWFIKEFSVPFRSGKSSKHQQNSADKRKYVGQADFSNVEASVCSSHKKTKADSWSSLFMGLCENMGIMGIMGMAQILWGSGWIWLELAWVSIWIGIYDVNTFEYIFCWQITDVDGDGCRFSDFQVPIRFPNDFRVVLWALLDKWWSCSLFLL